jgi:hypothetical protein
MIPPPGAVCAKCDAKLSDGERFGYPHSCGVGPVVGAVWESMVARSRTNSIRDAWAAVEARSAQSPPWLRRYDTIKAALDAAEAQRAYRRAARWSPFDLAERGADLIASLLRPVAIALDAVFA